MKKTLSTYEIAEYLIADENANWSRSGAFALAEYLEELETDCGNECELDVVAIRCEFSQYDSLQDWAVDYFNDEQLSKTFPLNSNPDSDDYADIDDCDEEIRLYVQQNGMLVEFDGGIIVSSF